MKSSASRRQFGELLLCLFLPIVACLALPKDSVFFMAYALLISAPLWITASIAAVIGFWETLRRNAPRRLLMAWLSIVGFMIGITIVIQGAEQEWARILDVAL
jgi:hypothetical protein